MAAFVRVFAQKVTAEICPVEPLVMSPMFEASNQHLRALHSKLDENKHHV